MREIYREICLKREVSTAKKVMLVFVAFSLVMLFTIFLLFNKSQILELTGNIIQILSGENQIKITWFVVKPIYLNTKSA